MTKVDEKILALLDEVDRESANLRRAIGYGGRGSLQTAAQSSRILTAATKVEKELNK